MLDGIWLLIKASRLVFITGMQSHPRNAPRHHMTGLRKKASMKFSVLIEMKSERIIILTLLFGVGIMVAIALPMIMAIPAVDCTAASTLSQEEPHCRSRR